MALSSPFSPGRTLLDGARKGSPLSGKHAPLYTPEREAFPRLKTLTSPAGKSGKGHKSHRQAPPGGALARVNYTDDGEGGHGSSSLYVDANSFSPRLPRDGEEGRAGSEENEDEGDQKIVGRFAIEQK